AGGSEARGLWPFTSAAGGGGPEAVVAEQALVRPRPSRAPTSYSGIAAPHKHPLLQQDTLGSRSGFH
ncbi:hypothetical protein FD755_022318, partial [Muntiacus reevesi]